MDQFLDPETDVFCHFLFLDPETDIMDQFLGSETDIMGEGNFMDMHQLTNWQSQT